MDDRTLAARSSGLFQIETRLDRARVSPLTGRIAVTHPATDRWR